MKITTRIYLDSFLQNIKNVCFFTFLPVLIAKLGASPLEISLSTSLPPLFSALSLAFLTRQLPMTYGVYYTAGIIRQICFLCMAISALLPNPIYWLLFFWACNAVVVMITSVQQQALIRKSVPENYLSELFSKTKIIGIVVAVVGTYAVGKFLDSNTEIFPYNYVISMVVGAVATFAGMSLIARLAPKEKQIIKLHFVLPLRKVTPGLIAITIAVLGINLLAPLWTIYHVNKLNLSNLQIAALGIVTGLVGTVMIPILRKKMDSYGPKNVIVLGCAIMALMGLFYGYITSFYVLLILNVIRGLALSCYDIAQQTLAITESKNHDNLITFFSDYQLVQNLATGIAPFICPLVLMFMGVDNAFVLLSTLGLFSAVIVRQLFKRNA